MNTIESAAPSSGRQVIDVQQLLGLPDSTPNPHLWYNADHDAEGRGRDRGRPGRHPARARRLLQGEREGLHRLPRTPGTAPSPRFKQAYAGVPVATTEPVADYMLQAAGADNLTPWTFQADIMNGVDPSPQVLASQKALFTEHKVKVFLYNQQVTDPLTQSLITLADQNGIPVVGVYETMPVPGYDYQSWMLAEVQDLRKAVADKVSTEHL